MKAIEFPFPSNGKVHRKMCPPCCPIGVMVHVSIPFKRESASQEQKIEVAYPFTVRTLFPFPSIGKAYPKIYGTRSPVQHTAVVSIPFKRESVSKADHTPRNTTYSSDRFHSLQTGKRIQSVFGRRICAVVKVSIPFKRESVSKGKTGIYLPLKPDSFNSLQTGKWMARQQFF